jgi:putative ABC transport system substrate-binding protein
MKRREVITLLGGAAAAWPLAARAQQTAMPVVGFLHSGSREADGFRVAPFLQGLKETGYVEGQNVTIQYRWADGNYDRLPALADDLVRSEVSVIAPGNTPATLAARAATNTIPIVFGVGGDPVELGLVASLSRPGGNLTGATTMAVELGAKQLELLRELVPAVAEVALLVNPSNPALAESQLRDTNAAAHKLGLRLHVLQAATERDFEMVFERYTQLRAGGLVIGADVLFTSASKRLAALASRYGVVAMYAYREFAAAGGLMSYGGSLSDVYRLTGAYAGRILKGEKPANLPVQQTTKIEFVLNIRTAKALGLTIPPKLLVFADEVIE